MVKYTIVFIINFAKSSPAVGNVPSVDKPSGIGGGQNHAFNVKHCERRYVRVSYENFAGQTNNVYVTRAGKVAKIVTERGSNMVMKMAELNDDQDYWVVFAVEHGERVLDREHAMKYFNGRASFTFTFDNTDFPAK